MENKNLTEIANQVTNKQLTRDLLVLMNEAGGSGVPLSESEMVLLNEKNDYETPYDEPWLLCRDENGQLNTCKDKDGNPIKNPNYVPIGDTPPNASADSSVSTAAKYMSQENLGR